MKLSERNRIRAQKECDDWNREHPTPADVVLCRDNDVTPFPTRTRSDAYVCEAGYPVIFLDNVRGYYLLERVSPASPATQEGQS